MATTTSHAVAISAQELPSGAGSHWAMAIMTWVFTP